jgi:cysteine desulfurase
VPGPIYLDHHATTPVDPRVLDAMLPYFAEKFGNASSRHHAFGWAARDAVEDARARVASLIGASPRDIVFTSGATESDNLAIKGLAGASRSTRRHIVTVVTEHRAVLDPCRRLEQDGFRVTRLGVGRDGLVSLADVRDAVDDETLVVSVMTANNEIGVIQPIGEIAAIARSRGARVHTDAVQAAGKIPFDVNALGVDLASITAHKMYGPKGVGALYVRRGKPRIELAPLIDGGGHERGLRSGTLNVPAIVGFGAAAQVCGDVMAGESVRLRGLRDRLSGRLHAGLDGLLVNGSMTDRLPHNLSVSFRGVHGEALLMSLGDIAVSTGAACATAAAEPSHVLEAIGLDAELARSTIRFGLGRFNTAEDVDAAADAVVTSVRRLREMSPLLQNG